MIFYAALLIFCVVMTMIYSIKPSGLYDSEKKRFRQFGVGDDETLLSLPMIAFFAAILSYCLVHKLSKFEEWKKCDTNVLSEQLENVTKALNSLKTKIVTENCICT